MKVENKGYCIFLEPGEDCAEKLWFAEWIKYRDDLPAGVKEWLNEAHVEPGESVPVFGPAGKGSMVFMYKGMAEKTAEKIADKYPEFEGRLHVMPFDEVTFDE